MATTASQRAERIVRVLLAGVGATGCGSGGGDGADGSYTDTPSGTGDGSGASGSDADSGTSGTGGTGGTGTTTMSSEATSGGTSSDDCGEELPDGSGFAGRGFSIEGDRSMATGVGDLNEDGLGEVLAGPYLVFGKTDEATVLATDIEAGLGGFHVQFAPRFVAGAGDVDGDGTPDLLFGDPLADGSGINTGRVSIVFGKPDTAPVAIDSGVFVDGETEDAFFGRAIGALGDLDGDGLGEVAFGAPRDTADGLVGAGRVFVLRGRVESGAVPLASISNGTEGFELTGITADHRLGWMTRGLGDVTGDGLDEILISAVGLPDLSHTYVLFGALDMPASIEEVEAGTGGFVIEHAFGGPQTLDAAGDVNGDGLSDIVLGTHSGALVVFGKSDTAPVTYDDLAAGDGGFVIETDAMYDGAGDAVAGAGDVNGDGFDDVVIGAYAADGIATNSGRAYVVLGRCGTESVDLDDVAAGVGGFSIDGEAEGAELGTWVGGAGDVNGDGFDDIVVLADDAQARQRVLFGEALE